jgi:hypothetical protein
MDSVTEGSGQKGGAGPARKSDADLGIENSNSIRTRDRRLQSKLGKSAIREFMKKIHWGARWIESLQEIAKQITDGRL